MSRKFYWLKLKRDFFKRHDIRILAGMPDGSEIVLLYLKLLCEAVDHNGDLRFSETVPYDAKMLSCVTDTPEEVISEALGIFQYLGLVSVLEDKTIHMNQIDSMLGCETEWAEKKQKQRALPALENGSKRINGELIRLPNGNTQYVDEKRYGGNGMLVLDRAGGKCELCGSEDSIVIHHNNGYSNAPEDLLCLCSKCHGLAHSKEHGGHIDIKSPHCVPPLSPLCPPFVPQMSDKRLENKRIDSRDRLKEKENKEREKKDTAQALTARTLSNSVKKFSPPSLEELETYCKENKLEYVDAQKFMNYYESNGWRVGRNPMKDWRAAARSWNRNQFQVRQIETGGKIPILENHDPIREPDDPNEILKEILGG